MINRYDHYDTQSSNISPPTIIRSQHSYPRYACLLRPFLPILSSLYSIPFFHSRIPRTRRPEIPHRSPLRFRASFRPARKAEYRGRNEDNGKGKRNRRNLDLPLRCILMSQDFQEHGEPRWERRLNRSRSRFLGSLGAFEFSYLTIIFLQSSLCLHFAHFSTRKPSREKPRRSRQPGAVWFQFESDIY